MVGAPVSYSGNHPYPPTTTATYPPNQAYASPRPLLSALLPYDGLPPQGGAPHPWGTSTSPETINMSYLYPPSNRASPPFPTTAAPYPPTSPPPFPPFFSAQANPYNPNPANPSVAYSRGSSPYPGVYPPVGYPPQPDNPHAPTGYPTGQPAGNHIPATSAYPTQQERPNGPYGAGSYTAPPHAGGAYPRNY